MVVLIPSTTIYLSVFPTPAFRTFLTVCLDTIKTSGVGLKPLFRCYSLSVFRTPDFHTHFMIALISE